MRKLIPEKVVEHRCVLGEGPIWDHVAKMMIWLDIDEKAVHRYGVDDGQFRSALFEKKVTSVVLKSGGGYMATVEDGFAEIGLGNGMMIMRSEINETGNRFNDGKCDPQGRFWAGTTSIKEDVGTANLYSLNAGFTMQKRLSDVTISNGMAWSIDGQIFYYVDSPTKEIVSYEFDAHTGSIAHKKIVFRISNGYPDGMTIDNEGMLWVAIWDGGKVIRINPESGKKIAEILLPVSRVTSCVFGGSGLDDLYITTASSGLSGETLRQEPLAGALFVVGASGYKGVKAFEYKEK